jgi:DNA-directed RNA polymerase specialized sigma24 family protein
MTEEEVLRIIDKIATRVAPKYTFGYYDVEDVEQEARREAIKGLLKYDGKRPLENFLWIHLKNRLFNLRRDKYQRTTPPCSTCKQKVDGKCTKYDEVEHCNVHDAWTRRNEAKKNLMAPIGISSVVDEHEQNMRVQPHTQSELEITELESLLDREIPAALRPDYLRMKAGDKVAKTKRVAVQEVVQKILEDHHYG